MAMHKISNAASVTREKPIKTWPSTMSIIPLIRGTPGTKYNTLVAIAVELVVSLNMSEIEAASEATKAETINTTNELMCLASICCFK